MSRIAAPDKTAALLRIKDQRHAAGPKTVSRQIAEAAKRIDGGVSTTPDRPGKMLSRTIGQGRLFG